MTPITKIPRSIKPSAAALLHGVGNSNDFYQWSDANKNAFEYRFNSLASSGDSRGVYAQMKFSGAGGGEVIRAFAKASTTNVATGGTINGIHATMSVDALSSVSGAGNAQRLTLGAAAATRSLGGTCAALQLDSDIGANNTVPASWAFLRLSKSGSVDLTRFMYIDDDQVLATAASGLAYKALKVNVLGTDYYINLLAAS